MQEMSELVLAAGMATVGLPGTTRFTRDPISRERLTMVRFVNATPGLASVAIAGRTVFSAVPTGAVTDYTVVGSRMVTFTLVTINPFGAPVSIDHRVEEGGHYTLTATVDTHGGAAFSIAREQEHALELVQGR